MSNSGEGYALARAGDEALRRGEFSTAYDQFRRATTANPSDINAWLGLATAAQAIKNFPDAFAAIDRVLALAPRSSRALIVKADLFAATGDARAASTHYTAAIKNAPAPERLPPDQQKEIHRAQQMCAHYAREYETFLREKLSAAGFDPSQSSARFAQSLDLMTGRKQIYLQQPTQYYFPELPQIQFYDCEHFSWLKAVESATDDIVTELQDVLKNADAFRPYVEGESDRPRRSDDRMTDNPDWSAFYLWQDGRIVEQNAARCPKTMRALKQVPLCLVPGRAPSVLFSQMRAGARIPPHTGNFNARLICHLPLIVPDHCGFRVGNDVRAWEKGKAWAFDDTIEHEAWNDSRETRIILLFEIWRPELNDEERRLVSALVQALGADNIVASSSLATIR